MFLADTLSRAYLPRDEMHLQTEFETINPLHVLPMSKERVGQIPSETENDRNLGQSSNKVSLWTNQERHHWLHHTRDELAVTDGREFRGESLVIPQSTKSKIKKVIHVGHT